MSNIEEGKEVFVRGRIISVDNYDKTCMVLIDSEDSRAILRLSNDVLTDDNLELRAI